MLWGGGGQIVLKFVKSFFLFLYEIEIEKKYFFEIFLGLGDFYLGRGKFF